MERKKIWLSISLFCIKSEWHSLINDGITSFVKDNSLVEAYLLQFNYLCGENIRFSLLTREENASQLAKIADSHFKKHFSNSNHPFSDVLYPIKGIFMSFPSNTIQYGLYPPIKTTNDKVVSYSLQVKFSEIMTEALKEETIDDETILTFAFYLQIGLIEVIDLTEQAFISALKKMFVAAPVFEVLDKNIIISKYEESKFTLMEINKDIRSPTNGTDLPSWLEKWLKICKNELDTDLKKNIDVLSIYAKVSGLIVRHLGITAEMNSILLFFIQQTLFNEDELMSLNDLL